MTVMAKYCVKKLEHRVLQNHGYHDSLFSHSLFERLLSEKQQRSKKELRAMEDHIKRMEKLGCIGEMAPGLGLSIIHTVLKSYDNTIDADIETGAMKIVTRLV